MIKLTHRKLIVTRYQNNEQLPDEAGISIFLFFRILFDNFRLLIFVPCVVSILIAFFAYVFLPPTYSSTVTFITPVPAQRKVVGVTGIFGFGGAGDGDLYSDFDGGYRSVSKTYINMLESDHIRDEIIRRLELRKIYSELSLNDIRVLLRDITSVNNASSDWSMIKVKVVHRNNVLAAEIANSYPKILQELIAEYLFNEAKLRRDFYAKQILLLRNKINSQENEIRLKGVDPEALKLNQSIVVNEVAALKLSVAAKEIHLNSLASYLSFGAPDYLSALNELNSLKTQLNKLNLARVTDSKVDGYSEMFRDYLVDLKLAEEMVQQLQLSEIDINLNNIVVKIIDPAVPAMNKSMPDIFKMLIVSGLGAGIFFLILIYVRFSLCYYWNRVGN